jgi:transcriptional regulator with XRE-family HTH domain
MSNPDKKNECIRLRTEERLSFKEITERTQVSKGTLSEWLKMFPLTPEETAKKTLMNRLAASKAHPYKAPKVKALLDPSLLRPGQNIDPKTLTRRAKGQIAEVAVLFRLTLLGLTIYSSPFDSDRLDWLVKTAKGTFVSIQVRWVRWPKHGAPRVSNLRLCNTRSGKAYNVQLTEKDYDLIVGYDLKTDSAFIFTAAEMKNRCARVVRLEDREAWSKLTQL